MLKINFRRFICRILKKERFLWLWNLFDCKRYEDEPEIPVYVCVESKKLPKKVCPVKATVLFRPEEAPSEICGIHEEIIVSICADSGLRANENLCPNVEKKPYLKGTEPQAYCGIHKPKPKPELEIGLSAYQLIKYPIEDIGWFLDRLKENGASLTEVFFCFSWDEGWKWAPYKRIGTWKEADGTEFPLFTLKEFNEEVSEKWIKIFKMMKEREIKPYIRIQDFCSLKDWHSKRQYCFRSFVERKEMGMGGDVIGGIWPPLEYQKWKEQKQYLWFWYYELNKHLVDILKRAGIFEETYFIPMNEADYLADPGDSELIKDLKVFEFHNFYFWSLTELGVNKEKIIFSVSRAKDFLMSLGCVFEIHGINSPERMKEALNDEIRKEIKELSRFAEASAVVKNFYEQGFIFPNGDGPDPYAQGVANFKGYRSPSIEQAIEMRKILLESPARRYAFLSREYEKTPETDLRKIDYEFKVLKSLVYGG